MFKILFAVTHWRLLEDRIEIVNFYWSLLAVLLLQRFLLEPGKHGKRKKHYWKFVNTVKQQGVCVSWGWGGLNRKLARVPLICRLSTRKKKCFIIKVFTVIISCDSDTYAKVEERKGQKNIEWPRATKLPQNLSSQFSSYFHFTEERSGDPYLT